MSKGGGNQGRVQVVRPALTNPALTNPWMPSGCWLKSPHFTTSTVQSDFQKLLHQKIRPSYLSGIRKYRFPVNLANCSAREESCLSGICNLLRKKGNHSVKLIIFMCSRIYPLSLKESGLFYSLWLGMVVYDVDSLNFPVRSSGRRWGKFPRSVFSFSLGEKSCQGRTPIVSV